MVFLLALRVVVVQEVGNDHDYEDHESKSYLLPHSLTPAEELGHLAEDR